MTSSGLSGTDANILSETSMPASAGMPKPSNASGDGFAGVMARLKGTPNPPSDAIPAPASRPEPLAETTLVLAASGGSTEATPPSGVPEASGAVDSIFAKPLGLLRNAGQSVASPNMTARPSAVRLKPAQSASAEMESPIMEVPPDESGSDSAVPSESGERKETVLIASAVRAETPPPTIPLQTVESARIQARETGRDFSDVPDKEAIRAESTHTGQDTSRFSQGASADGFTTGSPKPRNVSPVGSSRQNGELRRFVKNESAPVVTGTVQPGLPASGVSSWKNEAEVSGRNLTPLPMATATARERLETFKVSGTPQREPPQSGEGGRALKQGFEESVLARVASAAPKSGSSVSIPPVSPDETESRSEKNEFEQVVTDVALAELPVREDAATRVPVLGTGYRRGKAEVPGRDFVLRPVATPSLTTALLERQASKLSGSALRESGQPLPNLPEAGRAVPAFKGRGENPAHLQKIPDAPFTMPIDRGDRPAIAIGVKSKPSVGGSSENLVPDSAVREIQPRTEPSEVLTEASLEESDEQAIQEFLPADSGIGHPVPDARKEPVSVQSGQPVHILEGSPRIFFGPEKKRFSAENETEIPLVPSWQFLRAQVSLEKSRPVMPDLAGTKPAAGVENQTAHKPLAAGEQPAEPVAKHEPPANIATSSSETAPVASSEQARLACPEPKAAGSFDVAASPEIVSGEADGNLSRQAGSTEKPNKSDILPAGGTGPVPANGRRFSPSKPSGTPVAQQSEAMRFDGHQPEIAGSKFPVPTNREFSASSRSGGVEALVIPQPQPQPELPVNRESLPVPADVRRSPALQMDRLAELVSVEATILRQFKPGALTAVVRPDPSSELRLELRMHRGQVEAHAVLEKGDVQAFSAGWEDLQKSLRAQGIELQPLTENSSRPTSASTDDGQRRQSSGREPNEREPASWALGGLPEVLKPAVAGIAARVVPTTGGTRHLLESWA